MKKLVLALLLLVSQVGMSQTSVFNELLNKHVSSQGKVDYAGLQKNEAKLDKYLDYLSNLNMDGWSKKKKMATLMNAYNAYTIKLILKNYPTKSIMNIKEGSKNAWAIRIAKIGNKTYTLDELENKVLRVKYFDPRIHVGVNCAAKSCPKLHNKAFTAANMDRELDQLMRQFINDSSRNMISKNEVKLSKIFEWYRVDFEKKTSLIEYINKYSRTAVNTNAQTKFMEYNWQLNK